MSESLVFSCAKILFLVSLFFVAVKYRSLLTFKQINYSSVYKASCVYTHAYKYTYMHNLRTYPLASYSQCTVHSCVI